MKRVMVVVGVLICFAGIAHAQIPVSVTPSSVNVVALQVVSLYNPSLSEVRLVDRAPGNCYGGSAARHYWRGLWKFVALEMCEDAPPALYLSVTPFLPGQTLLLIRECTWTTCANRFLFVG